MTDHCDRETTPAGVDARARDQDRTLAAAHQLEAAVEAGATGREVAWRRDVVAALERLDQATAEEEANAARPDSLVSDIARNDPRLRHRVHGLRIQYRHVRDTIDALRTELADPNTHVEVADLRQRFSWLLYALRHQRAREADLIYEALSCAEGDAGGSERHP